jgi:hypothetical protein
MAPVFDDWIACLRCAPRYLRRPSLSEREDHTCDLCGEYRRGQPMSQVHTGVGFVHLIIGVCPRCDARLRVAEAKS